MLGTVTVVVDYEETTKSLYHECILLHCGLNSASHFWLSIRFNIAWKWNQWKQLRIYLCILEDNFRNIRHSSFHDTIYQMRLVHNLSQNATNFITLELLNSLLFSRNYCILQEKNWVVNGILPPPSRYSSAILKRKLCLERSQDLVHICLSNRKNVCNVNFFCLPDMTSLAHCKLSKVHVF